jgi:hypothetical protein
VSKLALISATHRQNKLERKKENRKGKKNIGIWDERTTHTETTKGAKRKKVTTKGK